MEATTVTCKDTIRRDLVSRIENRGFLSLPEYFMNNPSDLKLLKEFTPFLSERNSQINVKRIWHVTNDVNERPMCKNCKTNYAHFHSMTMGYYPHCQNKNCKEVLSQNE